MTTQTAETIVAMASNLNVGREATVFWNGSTGNHLTLIKKLLTRANRLDCIVAFAKRSGFEPLRENIAKRLAGGMKARFVVGLDFYQSEPAVLNSLLKWKEEYGVDVFVGLTRQSRTFHPKVYRFDEGDGISILIGSANLTGGGMSENEEVSAVLRVREDRQVPSYINALLRDDKIQELTNEIIRDYEPKYHANQIFRAIADKRITRSLMTEEFGLDALRDMLREMKTGGVNSEFAQQVSDRKECRKRARMILDEIAGRRSLSRAYFIRTYDELAGGVWHSGGLQRSKTKIAARPEVFQKAIRIAASKHPQDIGAVFAELRELAGQTIGIGPNIISEILQTYDNKRFAIMNRNSVAGMRRANFPQFPERPDRQSVRGEVYAEFCDCATSVRKALKLDDLSQLDALFNYAYWREED